MSPPTCEKCAARGERQEISAGGCSQHAVMIGRGTFYDEQGKAHYHSGSPGGSHDWRCACGHSWEESYGSSLSPCPQPDCSYGKK